jgi:inorganic pyrophosphatase
VPTSRSGEFPDVVEVVVEIPIEHFFATYKLLEDKRVEVDGWAERDAALAVLEADRRRWLAERDAGELQR